MKIVYSDKEIRKLIIKDYKERNDLDYPGRLSEKDVELYEVGIKSGEFEASIVLIKE